MQIVENWCWYIKEEFEFKNLLQKLWLTSPFERDTEVSVEFESFQIPPEAAYLYDAVWIYARAAHKAITNGQEPSDGRKILDFIKGTTYQSKIYKYTRSNTCILHNVLSHWRMTSSFLGAMGYINHIDSEGDCQGNFTLLSRQGCDRGRKHCGMQPVATFQLNEENSTILVRKTLFFSRQSAFDKDC